MNDDTSGLNTTERVIIVLIVVHLIAGAVELFLI